MNDFSCLDDDFIKKNEGIIRVALKKYLWTINDDILQEARIWLCEAKMKYNDKRASWTTFAKYYIEQKYKNNSRKNNAIKRSPEMNGYSNVGLDVINENDLYLLSNNHSGKNTDDEIEAKCIYDYCMSSIKDERTKDIVKMRLEGAMYYIIGYKYGISKQRAEQIYIKEIKRIKYVLNASKWCKDFYPVQMEKPQIPILNKENILKLRLDGLYWEQICKIFSIGRAKLDKAIDTKEYPIKKHDKNIE
jgi:hypothetical protein